MVGVSGGGRGEELGNLRRQRNARRKLAPFCFALSAQIGSILFPRNESFGPETTKQLKPASFGLSDREIMELVMTTSALT